jgi:hypothetical protein
MISGRRRGFAAALAAACVAGGCTHGATPLQSGEPAARQYRVLFVGNSLTYVNDLPAVVAAVARSAGDTFDVATAAGPNLALIDHLEGATDALSKIRGGGWDYVVLQQGPTTQSLCRDSLVLWTRQFDSYIRAAGARPALLMTWPSSDRLAAFDDVRLSFQTAAEAVDGVFLPAGEAWRVALAADPAVPLYGPDGFHPSPTGTFLAALEIYERLSGHDLRTLESSVEVAGRPLTLTPERLHLLLQAAHQANESFPVSPTAPAGDTPVVTRRGSRAGGNQTGRC